MRGFVVNPLWVFNRNLMHQKELNGQEKDDGAAEAPPFILSPRSESSTNPLTTRNRDLGALPCETPTDL
jgi:hypothetical protein